MIRTVHLYGFLKKKYGTGHRFDINAVSEVSYALAANFKGFKNDFISGYYRIILGDIRKKIDISEDELRMNLGKIQDIHIIPIPYGAKSQRSASTMKLIAGLALMIPFGFAFAGVAAGTGFGSAAAGASIGLTAEVAGSTAILGGLTSAGGLASIGLSLALGGVSGLLAPAPKVKDYGNRESPDQRPSFLFNGPQNTSIEGLPVPLVYGRFKCGSAIISSGRRAEQI